MFLVPMCDTCGAWPTGSRLMWPFGGSKDWNVIAVIVENPQLYRVNGNRARGSAAVKTRDGAKNHDGTLYWGVFDQRGSFLEGGVGRAKRSVDSAAVEKLVREFGTNQTIRAVLRALESGEHNRVVQTLVWEGYPAGAPRSDLG